ncbi:tRNA epoxyqueuosine(34) reductase QueG [Rubrobacter aplysinae]|uniref:tRNA epoxyqueuosine(34) reductase QueG n=1 Tax=Rubrobacter aplysinae TaxID=909625 RepID=UPI00069E9EE8|nr:tRNA epoxyqueuosine(34) reductase QueG [Rubrobacter aplysinae]
MTEARDTEHKGHTEGAEARRVLEELARERGFDLVGVARAEPLVRGGERLRQWQEAGMSADMGYMQRPPERLSDPRALQKSARSVVSLGVSYYPGDHPESAGGGRVARYAWGRDYHEVIKGRLFELRSELEERLGVRIKARGFTDAVPLLERSAAQNAGLGFFGRNACLISQKAGSYFFIADLLVDLDLPVDEQGEGTCGRCTRCMSACPTGAIKAPGVVDARLCISYLTIENAGEIPRDLRPKVGDWAFGCDICQEVCPYNKTKAARSRWPEFSAEAGAGPYLDIPGTLAIRDDTEFERRFSGTPLTRPGRAGMLRNCCVSAGNQRDAGYVPALAGCLREDGSPLVRGHAAWALGRIGGAEAAAALEESVMKEEDGWVLEEVRLALEELGEAEEKPGGAAEDATGRDGRIE